MDTTTVINLIETVSKTLNQQGFEHISLNHEGTSLTLNKKSVSSVVGSQQVAAVQQAPVVQQTPATPQPSNPSTPQLAEPTNQPASEPADAVAQGNFKTIDSPIVGTFYDSPSPEAEAYVKVGDQVKKGDVVCIIEAMKLMNEIEAECDGEVVEILVQNEGPVEYGQALFKLK